MILSLISTSSICGDASISSSQATSQGEKPSPGLMMKMMSTMQVPSPTKLHLSSVHLPELTIAMVSNVCIIVNTSTGMFCLFHLVIMYAYCTFFCLCLSADSSYWQKTGAYQYVDLHITRHYVAEMTISEGVKCSSFHIQILDCLNSPSACSSELRRIYMVKILSLSMEVSKLRHSTCDSVCFISSTVFLSLFVALKPLIERQADVKKTNCKTQV